MKSMLKKWFTRILSKWGFSVIDTEEWINTKIVHSNDVSYAKQLEAELAQTKKALSEKEELLSTGNALDKIALDKKNADLMLEQDRISAEMKRTEEYYNKVQEQLSVFMHADPPVSFSNNMCFPGATALSAYTTKGVDDQKLIVSGRTVMMDNDTENLRKLVGLSDKYSYGINYLMKNGLIDKISHMIVNGAIELTYGYNSACTAMELYYSVKADIPAATIKVDYEKK